MAAPIGPARQEARGIFRPPLLRSDLVPLLRRRRRRHGAVVVRSPPPRGRGGSSRLPLAGGQQRDEIVLLHHAHDGQVRARLLHARRAQLRPSRANQTPLVSVARRQSTQYSVRRVAGSHCKKGGRGPVGSCQGRRFLPEYALVMETKTHVGGVRQSLHRL
eukprot:4250850-Pyramimonas_sp.AAC.1